MTDTSRLGVRLPVRKHIKMTASADPLKFYYLYGARGFYCKRFKDACTLMERPVEALLDFGTGSGIFLPELKRWCRRLFACDIHQNLQSVREMLAKEGIEAEVASSLPESIPFADESMDAVVSMSVLEHIANLSPCVAEIGRVLKPRGRAIIGVPVDNVMTKAVLRMSYLLLPGAKLEDEHVSTHADVLAAFSEKFDAVEVLHIPRRAPESLRMYTTTLFRKRGAKPKRIGQ